MRSSMWWLSLLRRSGARVVMGQPGRPEHRAEWGRGRLGLEDAAYLWMGLLLTQAQPLRLRDRGLGRCSNLGMRTKAGFPASRVHPLTLGVRKCCKLPVLSPSLAPWSLWARWPPAATTDRPLRHNIRGATRAAT